MRIITPSLTFAVRVFKRKVIQDLLRRGDVKTAKAVGKARFFHPDDKDTCMTEQFPVKLRDFPEREIDWNESRLWGKGRKFSSGPWYYNRPWIVD